MMKKGAIFDMDGLMFDTQKIYDQAWRVIPPKYGFEPSEGFINEIRGVAGEQAEEIVSRYFPGPDPKKLLQEGVDWTSRQEEHDLPKKPGIDEILQFLKSSGIRIAVASSSDSQMVNRNLRMTGVADYIDYVVCGDEVEKSKPNPDIFLKAAGHLQLAPEDCYVLEDSPNGILAAYRAGCAPVMVPDVVQPEDAIRNKCVAVCRDLFEVMQMMRDGTI